MLAACDALPLPFDWSNGTGTAALKRAKVAGPPIVARRSAAATAARLRLLPRLLLCPARVCLLPLWPEASDPESDADDEVTVSEEVELWLELVVEGQSDSASESESESAVAPKPTRPLAAAEADEVRFRGSESESEVRFGALRLALPRLLSPAPAAPAEVPLPSALACPPE